MNFEVWFVHYSPVLGHEVVGLIVWGIKLITHSSVLLVLAGSRLRAARGSHQTK